MSAVATSAIRGRAEKINWTNVSVAIEFGKNANKHCRIQCCEPGFLSSLLLSANNRLRPLPLCHYANHNSHFLLSFRWHAVNDEQRQQQKRVFLFNKTIPFLRIHLLHFVSSFLCRAYSVRLQASPNDNGTRFFAAAVAVAFCRNLWKEFFFAGDLRFSTRQLSTRHGFCAGERVRIYWGNKFRILRTDYCLLCASCKYFGETLFCCCRLALPLTSWAQNYATLGDGNEGCPKICTLNHKYRNENIGVSWSSPLGRPSFVRILLLCVATVNSVACVI